MYSESRGTEGNRNVVKILKFIDDMILSRYTEYVGDCTPIDMRFPKNARALAILSPVLFYYILLKIKARPIAPISTISQYLADMLFICCVQRVP